jgi:archaellum component FlaC
MTEIETKLNALLDMIGELTRQISEINDRLDVLEEKTSEIVTDGGRVGA